MFGPPFVTPVDFTLWLIYVRSFTVVIQWSDVSSTAGLACTRTRFLVWCLLFAVVVIWNTRSKTKQNQHKNNVTFKLMFWSFFLQDTTHRSQASPRTHARLACRLQLRPSNLVTLIHRCVQLGMQVFMLRGCFEHTCCCHYFVHANNRERILEHEHLLWLRIALRFQLRPPKFCQWYLGLCFCGCSHMGILVSFQLGVGSALCLWFGMCGMGGTCVSFSYQPNKNHHNKISTFKLRFCVS